MILLRSNIDLYRNSFPTDLKIVPRIGEKVQVLKIYEDFFIERKHPIWLEVKDVIHTENNIICELHYSKLSLQIMQQNRVNPF